MSEESPPPLESRLAGEAKESTAGSSRTGSFESPDMNSCSAVLQRFFHKLCVCCACHTSNDLSSGISMMVTLRLASFCSQTPGQPRRKEWTRWLVLLNTFVTAEASPGHNKVGATIGQASLVANMTLNFGSVKTSTVLLTTTRLAMRAKCKQL